MSSHVECPVTYPPHVRQSVGRNCADSIVCATIMILDNVIKATNRKNTTVAPNEDSGSVNNRNSFRRCFHRFGASCAEEKVVFMSGVSSWRRCWDSMLKCGDSMAALSTHQTQFIIVVCSLFSVDFLFSFRMPILRDLKGGHRNPVEERARLKFY